MSVDSYPVIITALGLRGNGQEEERAWDLMPVGDRPWIQHQLEHLIRCGQKDLTFILYHEPAAIQKLLGDGERWGATIRYRLASDPKQPLACMRGVEMEGPVVVGSSLVLAPPELFQSDSVPALLSLQQQPLPWLRLTPEQFRDSVREDWPALMQRHQPTQASSWEEYQLLDGQDLLARNQDFLTKHWPIPPLAREIEPGCWIGRDVVLHPSVQVTPPCYIGSHCRVGRLSQVGPGAVIGAGSILDDKCVVVNSVVTPGTYLGAGLELQEMTAGPGFLRLADGDAIAVPDPSLLGYSRPSFRWRQRIWQRALAWCCLLLFTPLRWLRSRPAGPNDMSFVSAGQAEDPAGWKEQRLIGSDGEVASLRQHFWQVFLPGLPACTQGRLALVGCTPLDSERLNACPAYRRRRYLRRGPGLVSESLVQFGPKADEEERELADALQAAQGHGVYSLTLLSKYFLGVLADAPHP